MKKTLLVLSALISFSAFAVVRTTVPTMLLENGFEFQSVKVTNVCVNENGSYQTINPVKKCVKYTKKYSSRFDRFEDENACQAMGDLHLYAPEFKKVGYCAEFGRDEDGGHDCKKLAYDYVKRPRNYEIVKARYTKKEGDWVVSKVLSTKVHTLVNCQ